MNIKQPAQPENATTWDKHNAQYKANACLYSFPFNIRERQSAQPR